MDSDGSDRVVGEGVVESVAADCEHTAAVEVWIETLEAFALDIEDFGGRPLLVVLVIRDGGIGPCAVDHRGDQQRGDGLGATQQVCDGEQRRVRAVRVRIRGVAQGLPGCGRAVSGKDVVGPHRDYRLQSSIRSGCIGDGVEEAADVDDVGGIAARGAGDGSGANDAPPQGEPYVAVAVVQAAERSDEFGPSLGIGIAVGEGPRRAIPEALIDHSGCRCVEMPSGEAFARFADYGSHQVCQM
ncbi:hypothetical protein ACTD5D_20495 [Nocardia takedensis]|uniref:hypothetical protein n=1 Tax=Nocardia takedensis TaxID=259390 RepID=UPI003F767C0C